MFFSLSSTLLSRFVRPAEMRIRLLLPIFTLALQVALSATEKEQSAKVTVPFPKDKPALTLEIPNSFAIDATVERLIIKPTKKHKSFFHLAAIPSGDGVSDDASAKAWLLKKAKSLLSALGIKDATARQEAEDYMPGIAGHKAFESRYSGGALDELQMWVFAPDGKTYFHAYYQRMTEDIFDDAEAGIGELWQSGLLSSIKPAK